MRRGHVGLLAATLLTGCKTLPEDDFSAAEALLRRGDLPATIYRLDRIPAADPRYPRARAFAQATERRLRTTHDLVAEGLRLRAEWRDQEAVDRFVQALEIWPEHELAARLLAATEARIAALDGLPADVGDLRAGVVLETRPLPNLTSDSGPSAGDEAGGAADAPAAPAGETVLFSGSAPPPGVSPRKPVPVTVEPNREWLAEIDRYLANGQLEAALSLVDASVLPMAPSPTRERVVRCLHQRALVHYGHGRLEFALSDWSRLLRIWPRHREARTFVDAARAEHAARRARR